MLPPCNYGSGWLNDHSDSACGALNYSLLSDRHYYSAHWWASCACGLTPGHTVCDCGVATAFESAAWLQFCLHRPESLSYMCSLIINTPDYFKLGISSARPVIIVGAAVCGRECTAWHWTVYTTQRGTWHWDPVPLEIESAVFTLQLRVQECFSSEIFHVTEKWGNYKRSLKRSCNCCCGTFAQEVCVSLCHYYSTTLTGENILWLASWLKMWNDTDGKKRISLLLRTRPESHLVIEYTLVIGGAFHSCFVSGKAFATDIRILNLCFWHLLPPQSLTALFSHCAPSIVFPKPQSDIWQWHPCYALPCTSFVKVDIFWSIADSLKRTHKDCSHCHWFYAKSFQFCSCEMKKRKHDLVSIQDAFCRKSSRCYNNASSVYFTFKLAQLW